MTLRNKSTRPEDGSKRRTRALRLAPIVLGALLLSSCFTAAVWHAEIEHGSGHHVPGYGVAVGAKLALTPFAILLDALTWPVQRVLWEQHYCEY